MKVLVRFKGDNDFGRVLLAFGDLLLARVQRADPVLTSQRIAEWFNAVAPHLYMMLQAREHTEDELKRFSEYLQIDPDDVYIDKQVDEKMQTWSQWGNYDSVMIDGSDHAKEKVYTV